MPGQQALNRLERLGDAALDECRRGDRTVVLILLLVKPGVQLPTRLHQVAAPADEVVRRLARGEVRHGLGRVGVAAAGNARDEGGGVGKIAVEAGVLRLLAGCARANERDEHVAYLSCIGSHTPQRVGVFTLGGDDLGLALHKVADPGADVRQVDADVVQALVDPQFIEGRADEGRHIVARGRPGRAALDEALHPAHPFVEQLAEEALHLLLRHLAIVDGPQLALQLAECVGEIGRRLLAAADIPHGLEEDEHQEEERRTAEGEAGAEPGDERADDGGRRGRSAGGHEVRKELFDQFGGRVGSAVPSKIMRELLAEPFRVECGLLPHGGHIRALVDPVSSPERRAAGGGASALPPSSPA